MTTERVTYESPPPEGKQGHWMSFLLPQGPTHRGSPPCQGCGVTSHPRQCKVQGTGTSRRQALARPQEEMRSRVGLWGADVDACVSRGEGPARQAGKGQGCPVDSSRPSPTPQIAPWNPELLARGSCGTHSGISFSRRTPGSWGVSFSAPGGLSSATWRRSLQDLGFLKGPEPAW